MRQRVVLARESETTLVAYVVERQERAELRRGLAEAVA